MLLIDADMIRAAAKSFPPNTAVGADNIAPRAILTLSNEGLQALAALLNLVEEEGKWPDEIDPVVIVLLAKSDGGHRPIGLFPTLVRLWMRVRTASTRAWERKVHSPDLYGGKGMGAQRAAWLEAFAAEAAVAQELEQGQVLLDLTKAFETVSHQELINAAGRKGYPLPLLRLALDA